MSDATRLGLDRRGAAVFLLLSSIAAGALPRPLHGVRMLAVVIGFYVIGNVHHALHTPLMSVTNAISGIIVVGALLQIGHQTKLWVSVLAFIAILVASINVFGGFTVTARMLEMFKREDRPDDACDTGPGRLHRRRLCSSSSRWPGCPSTRPPAYGQPLRHHRHGHRPGRTIIAATAGVEGRFGGRTSVAAAGRPGLHRPAMAIGARSASGGRGGRDDRHARADRDAAQLRRSGRRAGGLELLIRELAVRPKDPRRSRSSSASSSAP
jgi:hypothetical protein